MPRFCHQILKSSRSRMCPSNHIFLMSGHLSDYNTGKRGSSGNQYPKDCVAGFHPSLAIIVRGPNGFWRSWWVSASNPFSGESLIHTLSGCFWFGSGPRASPGHSRILPATLLEKETTEVGGWGRGCSRVPHLAESYRLISLVGLRRKWVEAHLSHTHLPGFGQLRLIPYYLQGA